tara:strand:- start:2383 stop:2970 length:588 start_codon:yes stop_codon:yes gene_type:complete
MLSRKQGSLLPTLSVAQKPHREILHALFLSRASNSICDLEPDRMGCLFSTSTPIHPACQGTPQTINWKQLTAKTTGISRELARRMLLIARTDASLWSPTMTSTQRRFALDQIEELPKDLLELGTLINGLPLALRQQLESSYTRVVESTRRRRRILTLVQEALGQLRLDMKYLTFDLDATRNERDALLDAQDEMED